MQHLDPKEGFHGYIGVAVEGARCSVILADFGVQRVDERACGLLIGRNIQVLDFFADDPRRHRVDIETLYCTAKSVRLNQRRPTAHKRVCDAEVRQVIRPEEAVFQAILDELREDQAAK